MNRSVEDMKPSRIDIGDVIMSPFNLLSEHRRLYAPLVISVSFTTGNRLLVIDDFGEELINKSRNSGVAILRNRTCERQQEQAIDIPQMTIPDATIVQISYECACGSGMEMHLTYSNQDIILDDELNMMLVRYYKIKYIS